jgi:hypothetical protein
MNKRESAFMTVFWTTILQRFNASSMSLQKVESDLDTVAKIYCSLKEYISEVRDRFDHFHVQASELCGSETEYEADTKRHRRRKKADDEVDDTVNNDDRKRSGTEIMRADCFNVIIDSLIAELSKREKSYVEVSKMFGFLWGLQEMDNTTITLHCDELVSQFPGDLDLSLKEECIQLRHYILQSERLLSTPNPITLCMELSAKQLTSTFPNVDTALRMFLCKPIANCSGERSFSAMKRVKNYNRSTTGQQRMDSLSLLTIECDVMNSIDYNDVIDTFAERKARKRL